MRRRWLIITAVVLLFADIGLSRLRTSVPKQQTTSLSTAALGMMLLDSEEGVSVLAVQNESAAERAGVHPTDILIQLNDTPFSTADELESLLCNAQDSDLRLYLFRKGYEMEIQIPLEP